MIFRTGAKNLNIGVMRSQYLPSSAQNADTFLPTSPEQPVALRGRYLHLEPDRSASDLWHTAYDPCKIRISVYFVPDELCSADILPREKQSRSPDGIRIDHQRDNHDILHSSGLESIQDTEPVFAALIFPNLQ